MRAPGTRNGWRVKTRYGVRSAGVRGHRLYECVPCVLKRCHSGQYTGSGIGVRIGHF